ncbi:MAG: hypothetical protein ABIZ05_05225 [Pseudonocardiaceae bacterium]
MRAPCSNAPPAGPVIVIDTIGEVDGPLTAGLVGVNTAVSECVPCASSEVSIVAEPPTNGTGEPSAMVPSWNWTVPAVISGVTVAMSITGVPWGLGVFGVGVSVVVVDAGVTGAVTLTVTGDDVDGPQVAGALGVNTAVSWCDPAANADMDAAAVPLLTITESPMPAAPSWNRTVPAAAGVTVAVSVTGLPWATGEAGDTTSVVLVAVTLEAAGGAAVATPSTNNTPPATTVTTRAPAETRAKNLFLPTT